MINKKFYFYFAFITITLSRHDSFLMGTALANCNGTSGTVTCTGTTTSRVGTGSGDPITTLNVSSGAVISTPGVSISLGSGTSSNQNVINVDGTVQNQGNGAGPYDLGPNVIEFGSNTTVNVGKTGTIEQLGGDSGGEAINVTGGNNTFNNYGAIQTATSSTFWFEGKDSATSDMRNTIENYGSIRAGSTGNDTLLGFGTAGSISFTNHTGATAKGNLNFGSGGSISNVATFYTGSTFTGNISGGGNADILNLTGDGGSSNLGTGITGFGTLNKTGTGTWTVGANEPLSQLGSSLAMNVDGGTLILASDTSSSQTKATINAGGVLQLGNGGTAGWLDSVSSNDGTLSFNRSDTKTYSTAINGSGSVIQGGTGTTILSANNGFTGDTTISAGTLALSGAGSISTSSGIHNNGTFDISGTSSSSSSIKALDGSGNTILGDKTLVLTDANSTFGNTYSGIMSGSGRLTIEGGAQTLSGANTYTGDTTVADNTQLNLPGSIASALINAGTTNVDGGTIGGTTTNTGTLNAKNATFADISNNAGQTILADSTANAVTNAQNASFTATGGTLAAANNAGTMTLDAGITVTGDVTNSGTLTLDSNTINGKLVAQSGTVSISPGYVRAGSLSGSGNGILNGNLTLTDATDTYSGILYGLGGLTIAGGVQTLSGANTYSGDTTVDSNASLSLEGSITSDLINAGTTNVSGGAITGKTINSGTLMAEDGTLADIDNNAGKAILTDSTANAVTNAQGAAFTATGGTLASAVNAGTMTLGIGNTVTGDVFNSGDLTLGGNTIRGNTTNTGTLNAQNATLANIENNAGQATLTNSAANAVTNAQGATFTAAGGTLAAASNAGTMTLGMGNTVTGDVSNSGDLTLDGDTIKEKTANTGTLNAQNATLANIENNAGQATLTNSAADAVTNAQGATFTATGGTFAQASNAGTMTLDAGNTVSGNVTNTGDLTLDGSTIKGTLAAQSGTFTVAPRLARLAQLARANVRSGSTSAAENDAEIGSLSGAGNGTLNGSLTLTAAEDDYSGVMSGPGGLTVEGGTQTLSGANTFIGNTTVARNAELILPGSLASAVINAGTMTVNSGEVGGNTANTGTINADNAIFADIDNNAGQAILTNSTANTVTNEQGATFTVTGGKLASASNAGTMNLTAGNVVMGDVINSGDLSLDSNSISGQTVNTGTLNAENATLTDLDNNAGQATVTNSSVGTVTNAQGAGFTAAGSRLTSASNAGIMALQSGNIVTGNVINNGDLTLDSSSITGTLAAQSGTFAMSSGNAQAGSLSGAGNGSLNGSMNLTNAVDTYSGVMSGPGGLTITGGAQTLTGDNAYTGITKVSSGALYVNGNQQAATGATTVSAGALVGGSGTIGGDVYIGDNGTLLPGASRTTVGTLTINGSLTLAGNAVQNFSFGQAYTEGGQYNDLVRVKGNLNFGGILNLTAPSSGPDVERIAHGFGFGNGVYRVYTYGGTLAGAQNARLGLVSPATGTTIGLQTAVNHQINLIVSDGTLTFWDGGNTQNHGIDGSSGNGTVDGGDGSWTALNGAGDNNWTDAAGSRNQPWAQKQFAIFEGPAGKVTVIGKDTNGSPAKLMFSGMQFANNDGNAYTITGDDLYATTARTVIRVGDGTGLGSKITANLDTVINDRDVKGGTSLVKSDAGSLVITKDQSYSGATEIEGGTLQLGNGGTSGQISGSSAIHNDGVLAIDHSNAVTLAQAIDGKGSLIQSGSGTTTLTGQNSYSGKTSIARGTLKGSGRSFGSSAIDIGEEGTLALEEQGRSTLDNTISGTGLLTKLGAGTSVLTRDNDNFSGMVDVTEGDLSINGSMRSATFNARQGGTLSGTGTLGKTTIGSDGRLSPAGSGSLGELTVDGNLTMQQGSTLAVDGDGQQTGLTLQHQGHPYIRLASDLVKVQGAVNLNGGTVALNVKSGSILNLNRGYKILQSTEGVTGKFDQLSTNITSDYLYLSPALIYSGNDVDLLLNRNYVSFSAAGISRNQIAAGHAIDGLSGNNALPSALLGLDKRDARAGLDAVSGELHASIGSALIEDASQIREAVNERLESADCDGGGNALSMRTISAEKGSRKGQCYSDRAVFWTTAYGSFGRNYGNGNAATLKHTNAGFLMGADAPAFETARFGAMAGYSNSTFNVGQGRNSSGQSNNISIGGYASNHWNALNVRAGASYTWSMLSTRRSVDFKGYQGSRLSASYLAGTAQAFGEVGYKISRKNARIEPFAGITYVNLQTDSFREHNGSDALRGKAMTTGVTYSTFGVRASADYRLGKTMITPNLMVGYRHAFGLTPPTSSLRFANFSTVSLDTAGAPLASDVAMVNAGLSIKLTDRIDFGLVYSGQYGVQAIDSGAKGSFSFKF